jgi:hypothetical protein
MNAQPPSSCPNQGFEQLMLGPAVIRGPSPAPVRFLAGRAAVEAAKAQPKPPSRSLRPLKGIGATRAALFCELTLSRHHPPGTATLTTHGWAPMRKQALTCGG